MIALGRLCDIIHYVINICDDTIYICHLMCDWSLGAHKIMHSICFLKMGVTYMISFCMTKLEFPPEPYMLFRLEKLPQILCLFLHWVLSSFVDPYERFVMLLKSRSHTHHIYLLLLHWEYTKTCLPSRSIQKCSTPTLGANTKTCLLGFPSTK
jgi:hypothetical protein